MSPKEATAAGFTYYGYLHGLPIYLTDPDKEPIIIVGRTTLVDYGLMVIERVMESFYWLVRAERSGIRILVGPRLEEV